MTIGIAGIGGLGTLGIKLAKALGHTVVAISSSFNKKKLALEKGADLYAASSDKESMAAVAGTIDLILNTISVNHDVNLYTALLAKKGTIVQFGLISKPQEIPMAQTIFNKTTIAGSAIGGIKETQEVLDLCAKHGIFSDVKIITADKIAEAWESLEKSNADALRFVIDIRRRA